MIKVIFWTCVSILEDLGRITGLGYAGINVVLFVFIMPAVFLGLVGRVLYLEQKLAERGKAREIVGPICQILGGVGFVLLMFAIMI
jgi:hypothetical protein